MNTSKIKIKLGAIEIEYEGSESFLKEELPQLLSAVSDLYQRSHVSLPPVAQEVEKTLPHTPPINGKKLKTTTAALAGRLQVKTGPDLIMAAAAKLTFDDGVEVITYARLLEEIKGAAAYFKASYGRNFGRSINQLVKDGKLNEPTKNSYALTSKILSELESRIVEQ